MKIWKHWCENREAVFRSSTTQCVPIVLHEKSILPYGFQLDLNSQIKGSIYHMLLLPFLPFALFLRVMFLVKIMKVEPEKNRKNQEKEIELSIKLLSRVVLFISPYYKLDTFNLLPIAHLELRQWSCSIKSALKCGRYTHYHQDHVVFSVYFLQYLLKCIASCYG